MVGLAGIIFVLLPESAWWLVGKGKLDDARKVIRRCHGNLDEDEVKERIVSTLSVTLFKIVHLTPSRML